jgi:hypothetical protein
MSIKEENLIQYSGTLKPGQRLVKVGNTFMPVGVGGAFEPGSGEVDTSAFESDMTSLIGEDANIPPVLVSGMKFYKCADVDTDNKTWSGYELVLNDGKYSVSTVLTDGLQYSAVTPIIGSVYSQDALITVRYANGLFPEDGLVFHASLNGSTPDVAETGQPITYYGATSYSTVDGVPCVYMDGSSAVGMEQADASLAIGSSGSISTWFKTSSTNTMCLCTIGYGGSSTQRKCFTLYLRNGRLATGTNGDDLIDVLYSTNEWHHFVSVVSGTEVKAYLDGALVIEGNLSVNCTGNYLYLGACPDNGRFADGHSLAECYTGYLAACRIYNRVLTQEEITALSKEFTPIA